MVVNLLDWFTDMVQQLLSRSEMKRQNFTVTHGSTNGLMVVKFSLCPHQW